MKQSKSKKLSWIDDLRNLLFKVSPERVAIGATFDELVKFITEQLMLKGLEDFNICREELDKQKGEIVESIDNLLIELDKPNNLTIITIENIRKEISNLINKL